MAFLPKSPGISKALNDVFPVPIIATRSPTAADIRYQLGQMWVRKDTAQVYILAQLSSGAASWTLASPGASDVDTLTGDSGGAISPLGGNITLAGGTNITSVGAANTITFNLDAAITLATSVSSPIYTVAAATDLSIRAATGEDIIMKMGDAAGVNKISFTDSANVEVASINSDGAFAMGAITFSGLLTALASATISTAGTALNLGSDNSGDAVNIGVGNVARAISIGTSAAAHTVAIGNAAAGALTMDSGAGISIDAATASNVTVTGAGQDLTIASVGGSLRINSTENTAQAIYIRANGGTSETVQIHADQGTGVSSLYLLSDVGGLTLESTGFASADAINLVATLGGIDMDGALQINIASSQDAGDALRFLASAGGIDIDAVGAAGQDISMVNTGGSIIIQATESATDSIVIESTAGGMNILASGASAGEDINIIATGSSVNITATENAANSIVITSTIGGIDILAAGAGAGEDIDIVATGSSVNVTSTENDSGAIYIHADGGTSERIRLHADQGTGTGSITLLSDVGGITLSSGGDMTFSGTVKQVDAEFLYSSGTNLIVTQSPIMQTNATTGGVPTGATGDVNLMYLQDGCLMEQFIMGAGQTIIAPRMNANGLNLALDNTATEGAEYNFGARNNAKHAYTIGTSPAFFITAKIYVQDISGCTPLMVGFRKVEANNATFANYSDYTGIGLYSTTSATNVVILSELNGGGQTATDTTNAWGGDAAAQTVTVKVSGAGVATFEINGVAASVAPSFTYDNGDVVMPYIHFLQGTDVTTDVDLQTLKIGFQA